MISDKGRKHRAYGLYQGDTRRARQLPRPHRDLPRHAAARLRPRPGRAARAGHPHRAPRAGAPPRRRRARRRGSSACDDRDDTARRPRPRSRRSGAARDDGVHVLVLPGELTTAIGAIGDPEGVRELGLEGMAGVDRVVPISRPYKLASSELAHHEPTVFAVDGRTVGGDETFCLIAGPCTVESREQTLDGRAHGRGGRRLDAARRRLQAAHVAVRVQGARARRRWRSSPRRARRPGCRSSPSCSTPRTPTRSPSTPT